MEVCGLFVCVYPHVELIIYSEGCSVSNIVFLIFLLLLQKPVTLKTFFVSFQNFLTHCLMLARGSAKHGSLEVCTDIRSFENEEVIYLYFSPQNEKTTIKILNMLAWYL